MPEFYHIASILSVFLSVLIVIRKNKENHNFILALWLFLMGVNIFLLHRQIDHNEHPLVLTHINISLLLFQIPLPVLFVKEYILSSKALILRLLLFSLPAIFFAVLPVFVGFDASGSITIGLKLTDNPGHNLLNLYIFTAFPLSLLWAFFELRKLKRLSLNILSDISGNDFIVSQRFLISLFFAFSIYLFTQIFVRYFPGYDALMPINLTIVMISMSVIYLGIFGLHRTDIFTVKNFVIKDEKAMKNEANDEEKLKEILAKLEAFMAESKSFLRPRLSIKELSDLSGIPEHSISQAINTIKQQNFYDFINAYRVQEFIERVKSQSHKTLTLTAVAYECGFNSKSTFYEIFKKFTGLTPSQYIKKHSIDVGKMSE